MRKGCLFNILMITGIYAVNCMHVAACGTAIKHSHANSPTHSHMARLTNIHIMLMHMFVHANIKRELLLPCFLHGKFQFSIIQAELVIPQARTCTRQRMIRRRKEGSILIYLSFVPMPLINTCKCSVYYVFPGFTREAFWFKAILEGFSATSVQLQKLKCSLHFLKSALNMKAFSLKGKWATT